VVETGLGAQIRGGAQSQDENVGKSRELVIDAGKNRVAQAVLSFGSLMDKGNKLFAMPWEAFDFSATENKLVLNVEKEKTAPVFEKGDKWSDVSDTLWGEIINNDYIRSIKETREARGMKKVLMIVMALIMSVAFVTKVMAQDKLAAKAPEKEAVAPEIGKRITITGCLHKGTSWDTFVLLGVTERPADATAPIVPVPLAIYWLDSTDKLKPLVGEMVDVTGKVTSREAKSGTITLSIDPSVTRSTDVKVDSGSGGREVTTEKFDDRPRPEGTSGSPSSIKVARPVYNLAVDDVRAVSVGATGLACQ